MAVRRLAPGEWVLDIRVAEDVEAYEVHSVREGTVDRSLLTDGTPVEYTERFEGEAGAVHLAPMVDLLLSKLRGRRERETA